MGSDIVQTLLDGLLVGSLYASVAIGITLVFGLLGILNFAHGEFFTIGAFITFVITTSYNVNFLIALLVAATAVAILAFVLEKLVFRFCTEDHLVGLAASLGLVLILQNAIAAIWSPNPRYLDPVFNTTLKVLGLSIPSQRLFVMIVSVALIGMFYLFLQYTKTGKAIRAMAQNREAASLMGIKTSSVNIVVFSLGGVLAAIAGALFATLFAITPFMGSVPLMKGFVLTVLGGLGSVPGAILAGLLVGTAESFGSRFLSAAFRDGYGFIILIVTLLVLPRGLLGKRGRERV